MAAARKPRSFTEYNFSKDSRSLPTQAQSPGIAFSSKSTRGVGKQQKISLGYHPVGAPKGQLDQPSKDYYSDYDRFCTEYPSEQLFLPKTGLSRTGEGGSDQGGHNYVNKLQDRRGASDLDLPQNISTGVWAIPRPRREITAPKSQRFTHNSGPRMRLDGRSHWRRDSNDRCHRNLRDRRKLRSGWRSYPENLTVKVPSTITPAVCQLELDFYMKFEVCFSPETKPSSGDELAAEVKGIQAGLVHREKWSKNIRFRYNEAASKGVFTARPDNQIETIFFLKKISSQGPCSSTPSAEIRGSNLFSHSVGEVSLKPNKLDLFGRDWIRRWKDGPGRKKDWRSSRYLKSMRKREQAKFQVSSLGRRSYLEPSKATNCYLAITHSPPHIAVPKDMLRQKSTSWHGHSSCLKPKSSWQATNEMGLNKKTIFLPKSRARCKPWMTDPTESLDIEEVQRPEDIFSADSEISKIDDLLKAMVSTHTETSSPRFETPNAKSISLNHLLAPESFVGTILGACLRLKRLLHTEPHYEVYDAESLSDENQKYEVRAYDLRGLSLKVRNYRIRNLKRASARSSYIDFLEQRGKKWLVFTDAGADLVPEPLRDCQPLWCTKEEYDRAFPALEPRRPYNPGEPEKEAIQDRVTVEAYDNSFETLLEGELSTLNTDRALEVINKFLDRLEASFESCHNDNTVTLFSERRKKLKSPEQAKRLRDRQRLSRQKKRLAKTALRLGANSDSMSQNLDMTSEPPTETSLGNENNHLALDVTIARLMQEELEALFV